MHPFGLINCARSPNGRARCHNFPFAAGLLIAIAAAWFSTESCSAAEWRSAADLKRHLNSPVSNTWSGRELRTALSSFSKQYKILTFLDRRVNPGRIVQMSVQNVTLASMLQRLASEHNLGLTWIGPVAYFGPAETTDRLRTLAFLRQEEIRKSPASRRKALQQPHAVRWQELATPREVIAGVAAKYGATVVNPDELPHDLWAAGELPPMNLAEQLTVLCAGFEMTFRFDPAGTKLQLQPIPARVYIDRFYSVGRQSPQVLISEWQKAVPDATIKMSGSRIGVRGTLEEHEQIAAFRGGSQVATSDPQSPQPTKDGKAKKYDLRTEAPLNQLLKTLAAAESLEIRRDEKAIAAAEIDMDQVIKLEAVDLTLEQIIAQVLGEAGLAYKREGRVIRVFPNRSD
ncbi:MAG: STN domain-containing protein [Pirellulales bacterium]